MSPFSFPFFLSVREYHGTRQARYVGADPLWARVREIVLARIVRAAERIEFASKCKDDEEHIVDVDDTIGFLRRHIGSWECGSPMGLLPGLDDGEDVIGVDYALCRPPNIAIEEANNIAPKLASSRLRCCM